MWCPSCRADVAAELSSDHRRMLCSRCQSELGIAAATIPHPVKPPAADATERDARELLAKWATHNVLEPPTRPSTPFEKSETAEQTSTSSPQTQFVIQPNLAPKPLLPQSNTSSKPQHPPITKNNSATVFSSTQVIAISNPDTRSSSITEEPEKQPGDPIQHSSPTHHPSEAKSFVDHRHPAAKLTSSQRTPLDDYASEHRDHARHSHSVPVTSRRPNISTFLGQICAYSGVVLLTIGSVIVMWSLFGGPPNYMPTGWLTAAVGQMLLFLGVVTLMSSGMDQMISEVTWRIDHLAEEVHHMGLALDDLENEQRQQRLQDMESIKSQPLEETARKAA